MGPSELSSIHAIKEEDGAPFHAGLHSLQHPNALSFPERSVSQGSAGTEFLEDQPKRSHEDVGGVATA